MDKDICLFNVRDKLKAVILAGGFGTRISEESYLKPKPMIEIGDKPIIWHIMNIYAANGITDFIVCAGYKQNIIKEYFSNYSLYNSDVTFDFKNNSMTVNSNDSEPWTVTVADTGLYTMTGGRIKRIKKYLNGDDSFCLTYGDGVSDVPIKDVIKFHNEKKKIATITAVHPEGRFGFLDVKGDDILSYREKDNRDVGWINGGFMVLDTEVMDYIEGDSTVFEREPLESLASKGQLNAYKHNGYWQCMDTMRDKEDLQKRWDEGRAPWKVW